MLRYTHIAWVDKHVTKRLLDLALNRSVRPLSKLRGLKFFEEYLNVQFLPHSKHTASMKTSAFESPQRAILYKYVQTFQRNKLPEFFDGFSTVHHGIE
jgi:hypothetical protein